MSKYKLIKTYPNSPAIGTIVKMSPTSNRYFFKGIKIEDPSKFPEFWKKVTKKDYKILKFRCCDKDSPYFNRIGVLNTSTNLYGWEGEAATATLDEMLLVIGTFQEIYSVKRLSDGKIFTIGDLVENKEFPKYSKGKVSKIKLHKETVNIHYQGYDRLQNISHASKPPIFISDDGVSMYEHDTYYYIVEPLSNYNNNFYIYSNNVPKVWVQDEQNSNIKRFAEKSYAEEYVLMNKKSISLQQVNEILVKENWSDYNRKLILNSLKTLIK